MYEYILKEWGGECSPLSEITEDVYIILKDLT